MPAYIIFILISFVSSLVGLTVKENRLVLLFFPFLLLAAFIIEYYSWKLSESSRYNFIFYNLFTLTEFMFYSFFLNYHIKKFYKKGNIILYFIIAFAIATLSNIFFFQGRKGFHTYTYIAGCLFIVILCIIYFNFMLRFTITTNLMREPTFWIATGLLFYYACSFFVFGISNFVSNIPSRFYPALVNMGDFLNICLSLLLSIGFLCKINFLKLLRL